MKVRVCPKCSKYNLEHAKYCTDCWEELSIETLVETDNDQLRSAHPIAGQPTLSEKSLDSERVNQAENDDVLKEYYYKQAVAKQQAEARKKVKRRRNWLIFGGLLLTGLCICVWFYGGLFSTAIEQQDDWVAVTDAFMSAMAQKNVNKAYSLCSTQLQKETSLDELKKFVDTQAFVIFDGYKDMEISAWEISSTTEGTFAQLNGSVSYKGGYTGSFDGVLIKEGDEWKLMSFNVNVPPDKFDHDP